ncbi:hypothetical protein SBA2_170005 [Acidobacteriia bacterium SbA2]|nr:hypothetical protein SBA2_170005 [Acidobacteriia bacterium SbA2]
MRPTVAEPVKKSMPVILSAAKDPGSFLWFSELEQLQRSFAALRMTLSGFLHRFTAVGSRRTESSLSHPVAREDLRSSKLLCRPSRGFRRASYLSFSPRLSPWATFLRPPRRAPEPGRAVRRML